MTIILTPKRSWLTALACASSLGLPAAALAEPAAAASPVAGLCRSVMGLEPGEAHFDGCAASLADSADRLARGQAATQARQTCLERGLKPGTAELAVCAVQNQGRLQRASVQAAPALPPPAKSYFYASNAERRRRERLACASLGLDPTSPAFDSCVAGLASTLFGLDNPEN